MSEPIPMLLICPSCHQRHTDEGEFATKQHHTHACQCCGMVWRPALVATVGVRFLPGFKNESTPEPGSLKARVLSAIEIEDGPLTAPEVAARLDLAPGELDVVRTYLSKLHAEGVLERPRHGLYRLPPRAAP